MAQPSTRPHDPQPDTWIQGPPFEASDDRRASARVPTALKVRLGPAREPPSTTLLCEDVSEGGLFVRCGQPVQLGARFSVELTLASGEALYIPEAEVLYNVEGDGAKRGFGARFVSVTREAQQKLLDLARFGSDIQPRRDVSGSMIVGSNARTTSRMRKVDVAPTDDVVVPRVSDLRVASLRPSMLPDDGEVHGGVTIEARGKGPLVVPSMVPSVVSSAVASAVLSGRAAPVGVVASMPTALPSMLPSLAPTPSALPGDATLEVPPAVHDTLVPSGGFTALGISSEVGADTGSETLPPLGGEIDVLAEDDARLPARRSLRGWMVWAGGIAAVGLIALYLGGRGAPAGAAPPERVPGRVSGGIAAALTAPRETAVPVPSASPSVAPAGGALSKLDAEAKGGVVVAKSTDAAAAKAAEAAKVLAAKPEAAKAETAKAVVKAPEPKLVEAPKAEAKAPKVEAAKAEAPKAAAKPAEPVRDLDAAVARLDPKASKAAPAPAARKSTLDVAPGTKVRRTHVLREPARFVIDLETAKPPVSHDARVRVGRHDGFVRVVVDSPVALANGTATVQGGRLVIALEPR